MAGQGKLDRYDRRILEELQRDGRQSNQELAAAIQLSPSPCLRRVKSLEEAGVIDHYTAVLSPAKLDLKMMAFIQISMDRHTPDRFENFEALVAGFPEVLECHLVTGQTADYLLKVVVPDMAYYQEFLLGKMTRIQGVSGVHSSFVMQSAVNSTRLPLSHLDRAAQ